MPEKKRRWSCTFPELDITLYVESDAVPSNETKLKYRDPRSGKDVVIVPGIRAWTSAEPPGGAIKAEPV